MGGQIGWVGWWVVGPKRSPETTEQQVNLWRRIKKSFLVSLGRITEWESHMNGEGANKQNRRWKRTEKVPKNVQERQCVWNALVLNFLRPSILAFRAWAPEVSAQKVTLEWPSRSQVLSVDPFLPPIWEGPGVKLNILSEQTPGKSLDTNVRSVARTGVNGRDTPSQHPSFSHPYCCTSPLSPIPPPMNSSRSNGSVDRRWKAWNIFWSSDKRRILGRRWQKKPEDLAYAWGWGGGPGGWDQP